MSLIADIRNTWSAVRGGGGQAASTSPIPYTSKYTSGNIFRRESAPTLQDLQATVYSSTFRSVLDLISGEVGGVDWHLYRKFQNAAPDRERKPITNHLAWELWDQPNDDMTGYELRKLVEWHYDAVGEGYMVANMLANMVPESFWPVRPDRMTPVISKSKNSIAGWVYIGPDNEKIPLLKEEVIRIYNPHPIDIYRGTGAAQALLPNIETSLTATQFLKAFYANDATPGGMIELGQDEILEEDEYRQLLSRWNDRHKGVSRAHKVGILEVGSFKSIQVNMKDMQFTEMRTLTRDEVLEALRVHKMMMGISEDVNRANAEAGRAQFAESVTLNRCKLWYAFANRKYLKLFGGPGQTVELCYENPVPEDQAENDASLQSRTSSFKTLVDSGVDPVDAAVICGLPPMKMVERGTNGPAQAVA